MIGTDVAASWRAIFSLVSAAARVFAGRELYLEPQHGRADVDLTWIDFRYLDAEVLTRRADATADHVDLFHHV